eukprot:CAMPEP_0205805770 /NCGR_PEP_ID=MMETSP0205-20121125/9091_1 /ASSEMBLY_ACC=CAM_ASM_000278 /TAXON_ID=36767 /ORGANISM="Euplotes focardii, Strain TN1" /LENGTH=207 /DNA_ID=CAMNT_0053077515 /DNA_START=84 /DNA_END=707 /DNA_ORIENTATION=-
MTKIFSSEGYSNLFFEDNLDNDFELSHPKWTTPLSPASKTNNNIIFTAEKQQADDDNSSNLADTEEQSPEQDTKKAVEDELKEFDTNEQSYDSSYIKFNERDVDELLDMISKPNTDMNALLSEVLSSGPTDPLVKRKRAITSKVKGKRVRKSKEQLDLLKQEYKINSEWNSEDITALSCRLNLTKKQIYKWYWDQKINSGEAKPKNW